ncbi:MAG TPA: ABC transporter substrate-binding protein [Terriglobia bacterium]|nr:ABC transporter substrate-binding protein [Terriglobia bacterium]
MRHFAYRFLVASSAACLALAAGAATRPRYGGALRVEIQAKLSTFDPAEPLDVAEAEAVLKLRELIDDHLVRLDPQGQPQPALAISWEHDAQAAKWRFKLRPGVKWQDGAPLTPEEVVTALEGHVGGASVRLAGEALEIDAGGPAPGLLATLATDASLSVRRPAVGTPPLQRDSAGALPIGTGPFRLTTWEPGRRAVLQANEDYWDGRPYVDTIEIQMGRASRDELLDLELGKADVVELDPVEARRAQQEGKKIWTSAPVELLCLRFGPNRPAVQDRRVRLALAGSVDRAAIQKVLVQNYGDVAGSIFPQWLSGYAFLFPTVMNLDRARQLRGEIGAAPTLKVGYGPSDMLARQTAERVAVNARDAGITLQVAPLPEGWRRMPDLRADLLVQRARIDGPTLSKAALEAAASLGLPLNGEPDRAEQTYAAEREFLDTLAVVPLIHIPELVGIGPRVMDWSATPWGAWHLERVSLEGEKP